MPTGNSRIDSSRSELICGSDEVGYGAWAGPLLVVAVCVPGSWVPPAGLTDSKKLSEEQREALARLLRDDPSVRFFLVPVWPAQIDEVGVYKANIGAHLKAHANFEGDMLHVADGNLDLGPDIVSLPKADTLVPAVSAASVIAKVTRDQFMARLDEKHPGYGFKGHKGYGVPVHQEALDRLGPCDVHRMSYAPVKAARKPDGTPDMFALFDELDQD
jgi:ribonuclease HII